MTITIEGTGSAKDWLTDADPTVPLEAVRGALAKTSSTPAQAVHAEREER